MMRKTQKAFQGDRKYRASRQTNLSSWRARKEPGEEKKKKEPGVATGEAKGHGSKGKTWLDLTECFWR